MRTNIWMALLAVVIALPVWWFTTGAEVDQAISIPEFSHQSGYYEQAITLSVRSPARQAAVLLTTNGRDPMAADQFTEPLVLSGQQVAAVKSRLLWPDGSLGPVVAQTYFVNLSTELPVLNLTVEPDDLWDETVGIYVNTGGRGVDWERPGTAVFFDPLAQNGWLKPIGLRLHGGGSREFEKKSLRLYFRDERLTYPLFGETQATEFRQLVVHSGGQDLGEFALSWTLLRDQLASELAQEMGLYSSRSRPVLLFINGQPWGIYLLRDRPNERFLRDSYGVQDPLILDSPDSSPDKRDGSPERQLWDNLIDFAAEHDLTNPANYDYVNTQIDLRNFIDYHILQLYMANTDWPGHNYQVFRPQIQTGKWHWLVWDTNYTFGLQPVQNTYASSTAETDSLAQLLAFTDVNSGGRHALLFQKLWENPTFRSRFIARFDELLATTFAPATMHGRIDRLAAPLAEVIVYETGRWPHFTSWEANVKGLHAFVEQRARVIKGQLAMSNEQLPMNNEQIGMSNE